MKPFRSSTISRLILLFIIVFIVILKNEGCHKKNDLETTTIETSTQLVAAPDFPSDLEWLNSGKKLKLKDLRGKIVLLDFWTYGCINCMHIIPDLKALEKKYPQELVVIGIHSAKFANEQEVDNLRQAILRYGIEHPVLNDRDMQVWEAYGVSAWPTLFLIDPEGKIVARHSGEGALEAFDAKISELIQKFDAFKKINRQSLSLTLEKNKALLSWLSFPGKVLADEKTHRLFIADSGHHRVLISTLDGNLLEVIGQGEAGFQDGNFETARFQNPQGMSLGENNILYIADTGNHSLRAIDLTQKQVTTIAGKGKQAESFNEGGVGSQVALNSPWDLLYFNKQLYIAMAGFHQIWKMDLMTKLLEPYAGSGREARIDGERLRAALAQPSGLSKNLEKLYIADSESSSIRSLELKSEGEIKTVAGGDLFDFGDKDGLVDVARLQHPLAVAYHEGQLYIADTYNHKIKKLDLKSNQVSTKWGTAHASFADGIAGRFNEPSGLSIAGNKLYIADTNNHQIRIADLQSGTLSTLKLTGLEKLKMPERPLASGSGEVINLPTQRVKSGPINLKIQPEFPAGYKLNPDAPSRVEITLSGKGLNFENSEKKTSFQKPSLPLQIPLKASAGSAQVEAQLVLYYCRSEAESLCYFKRVKLEVPLEIKAESENLEIELKYPVTLQPS